MFFGEFLRKYSELVAPVHNPEHELNIAIQSHDWTRASNVMNSHPIDVRRLEHFNGCSALHLAVRYNFVQLVEHLLRQGLGLDLVDQAHATPLHYAAQYGHVDLVKLLVERGADVLARNKEQATPHDVATSLVIQQFLLPQQFKAQNDRGIAPATPHISLRSTPTSSSLDPATIGAPPPPPPPPPAPLGYQAPPPSGPATFQTSTSAAPPALSGTPSLGAPPAFAPPSMMPVPSSAVAPPPPASAAAIPAAATAPAPDQARVIAADGFVSGNVFAPTAQDGGYNRYSAFNDPSRTISRRYVAFGSPSGTPAVVGAPPAPPGVGPVPAPGVSTQPAPYFQQPQVVPAAQLPGTFPGQHMPRPGQQASGVSAPSPAAIANPFQPPVPTASGPVSPLNGDGQMEEVYLSSESSSVM